MKKISFGSFPFINIDRKTRMCLDKYLIKTFADQIIITDIFSNLNSAKDFFYLTPDIIIDQLYDFDKESVRTPHTRKSGAVYTRGIMDNEIIPINSKAKLLIDNEYFVYPMNMTLLQEDEVRVPNISANIQNPPTVSDNGKAMYGKIKDPYLDIVRRGFFILRNFYKKISNDPFYRDIVYLPVYSEKLEVLNPVKLTKSQFKYSFFILTNDLTKNLKLDEISFNESAVINALYIFTQLFPNKKLTDFNERDLDRLLRVYKFFEEYRISPIQFFTILYRLFYVFSQAKTPEEAKMVLVQMSKKAPFNQVFDDAFIKATIEVLEDFNKQTFSEIIKMIKNLNNELAISSTRTNEEKFWKVIEAILNSKGIMSLINNTAKTYAERLRIFNQNFKFRDIILLFEELVKYNKLGSNDIIKDTSFNLNFKLELNNETIAFNDQIIKKKLDETFANFLADANKYVKNLFKQKVENLTSKSSAALLGASAARREADQQMQMYYQIERELRDIQARLQKTDPMSDEYMRLMKLQNDLMAQLTTLTPKLNSSVLTANILTTADAELNEKYRAQYEREIRELEIQIENLKKKLEATDDPVEQTAIQQEILMLSNKYQELQQKISEISAGVANSNKNSISLSTGFDLQVAKTELGELYQEVKNLFMNPTNFNAFLKKVNEDPEILTYEGFTKFLEKNNYQTDEEQTLAIQLKDIDMAMNAVVDILTEQFIQQLESTLYNEAVKNGLANSYFDKIKKQLKLTLLEHHELKDVLKKRLMKILCARICKIFATTFKKNLQKGEISFNETTYGIHPVIKNLLKNPNNFKSFIFGFDELINLYDLLYLTEIEKYLTQSASDYSFRTAQRPPIKLTQVINKFNYAIEKLGINENPIWIISRTKIFLSLPDFMSLTRERIFNSIKKEDIELYCKIDYSKIWNEMDFGSAFGGKQKEFLEKAKKLEREIEKIEREIKDKRKECDKKKDKEKKRCKSQLKELEARRNVLLETLKGLRAAQDLFNIGDKDIRLLSPQDYI